jgi:hypothetical protein
MTPMTEESGAWVREHVWPVTMRKARDEHPDTHCPCQWGAPLNCAGDPSCHRIEPLASCETYITNRRWQVQSFTTDYEHPTASAASTRRRRDAMVWLADRRCRWVCPNRHVSAAPERETVPRTYELVSLFDVAEVA